ncbi:ABC transporter ATP-binding protein [Paracoccaceae bacterium]|nr:ABC transporter ATP-binding protein [Paracoccaceae bacterium]
MLQIENIGKNFGGVKAVDDLSFNIDKGEIVGLIGPNGSGKSTTINLICGVFPADSGNISLDNLNVSGLPTHERVGSGISRTFQNIRLFKDLSVWQNVWVALQQDSNQSAGWMQEWFGNSTFQKEKIKEILGFSGLGNRFNDLAGNLSFGEQRRLELARAIASKPKLILLDEPAAGMNSDEVADLRQRILDLKKLGLTVLLVEHVMDLVMNVVDRIVVLNFGKKIAEGSPDSIQNNDDVQKAYLGGA